MSAAAEPNTARSYLGAELARLRKMAGLGGRALATQLGISQAKVSRIETGVGVLSLPEIHAWADAVGADADARRHLLRLLEAAWSDVEPWRTVPTGRTSLQDQVRELEATARTVREFQSQLVPGLLQTPEYARRVFALVDPHSQMDHDTAVTARLRRQEALYDEGRQFAFLITEAALRWRPGPARLLAMQLDRIASLATLTNVTVGVVPWSIEAPAAFYEAFTVYTDRVEDLDTIVEIELRYASVTISDPRDIQLYQEDWQRWSTVAAYNDDAQQMLRDIATELRSTP